MATLTETAFYTRRVFKLTTFGIAALLVLKIFWGVGSFVWQKIFPPPPPPPTVSFGKIPAIAFPEKSASGSSYTYALETVGGGLPKLPPTMKVYFMPLETVTFGGYEKMKAQAERIGFNSEPVKIAGKINSWRFRDNFSPLRHLDYDATTGSFHLYYDYRFDPGVFTQKDFNTPDQIVSDATTYFDNLGLLDADLSAGDKGLSYFKLDTNRLVPASSLSEADAVAVTFHREAITDDKDNYPIVYPDPKQGLVSVLFSGSSDQNKKVIEVRYSYIPVERDTFATYPLISSPQAWQNLQAGHSFIAEPPSDPAQKQITIRKIYLAYFDPSPAQTYLQPVLAFSDGKDFLAYVPLISPLWLK